MDADERLKKAQSALQAAVHMLSAPEPGLASWWLILSGHLREADEALGFRRYTPAPPEDA